MPNGEADTSTVYEVLLENRASGPADAISKSVTGMLDRLRELKEKGQGIVKQILTRPLDKAGDAASSFRTKLLALGATIAGFLALRQLKRELTEIFNEAVRVESRLVAIANLTGSDQFAEQTIGWARKYAMELRVPREELFSISEGLAQIGINAANFDPRGIIAAGQAAGGVANVVQQLRQAALDPSTLLRMQETFRALPFERLQEIIRTTTPGDFQGRVEALNRLFAEVYGDTIERSRRSVAGLRQGLRELILQFRETVAGVGSPLFNFFREQFEKAVQFVEHAQPTIRALSNSISQILTESLRAVTRFVDFILERFGTSFSDIADKGDRFRTKFLIPMTAEIIGFITRIELFAEKAFGTVADFLAKLQDDEFRRKATAIGGIGGVVLGLLLRRPTLLVGGLALLGLHGKLSADSDDVNAQASIINFSQLLDDLVSSLPTSQEGLSDLALMAGIGLLGVAPPVGAGLILGALINKGYRALLPEGVRNLIEEYGGFAVDPAGAAARRISEAREERGERERLESGLSAVRAAENLDVETARGLAALAGGQWEGVVERSIYRAAQRAGRVTPTDVTLPTGLWGGGVNVTIDVLDPALALGAADRQVEISAERGQRSLFANPAQRLATYQRVHGR